MGWVFSTPKRIVKTQFHGVFIFLKPNRESVGTVLSPAPPLLPQGDKVMLLQSSPIQGDRFAHKLEPE